MRYKDFIADLHGLLAEVDAFRNSPDTHEDPRFRSWRHRTESLVGEAKALGYRLPGDFQSDNRFYGALDYGASAGAAFARDVNDTSIEVRHLIEQFERYGVPPLSRGEARADPELSAPERVTLSWLVKNVPVGTWMYFLGALLLAFLVGAAVGRTEWYAEFVEWVRQVRNP